MVEDNPKDPSATATTAALKTSFVVQHTIDITGDVCPMTFVRTRLALDRLPNGAVLAVRLRGEEPTRNVPRTAEAQGHTVLGQTIDEDGVTSLLLRRG